MSLLKKPRKHQKKKSIEIETEDDTSSLYDDDIFEDYEAEIEEELEEESEEEQGSYEDYCLRCHVRYHTLKTCPRKGLCSICDENHSFY